MKITSCLLLAATLCAPAFSQEGQARSRTRTSPRPAAQRILGLHPLTGPTEPELVHAVLKDLPGQVVLVEEDAQPQEPWPVVRYGFIRIGNTRPILGQYLTTAPWMETRAVVSGGNTVASFYPIGWGY